MAEYGSFPGVQVSTESGGVSSVEVGAEEILVLFGEANYDGNNDVDGDDASLSASANDPEQIGAPAVADRKFGSDSELANAMKEALANGANIEYLYGVAVSRESVQDEAGYTGETGTLNNHEIVEDRSTITVDDSGGASDIDVEFRYKPGLSSPGDSPSDDVGDVEEIHINPLTGEFIADQAPSGEFEFDYEYNDYASAFSEKAVTNIVSENESGVWLALSDSDTVSSDMDSEVSDLRDNYQMVKAMGLAEPNSSTVLSAGDTTDSNGGAHALYDTGTYSSANSSVAEEYFFKFAPARKDGQADTVGGGLGGLFAGNPITDPIYNDEVTGYDGLQQQFSKSEADTMRSEDVIPIRSGGTIRVRGNRSTGFSNSNTVAATFWTRRITDRIILMAKEIGNETVGAINDDSTRSKAERLVGAQMRSLSNQRLIQGNTPSDKNWNVDVYASENNSKRVNIDVSFKTYGIVKEVSETITVDTS